MDCFFLFYPCPVAAVAKRYVTTVLKEIVALLLWYRSAADVTVSPCPIYFGSGILYCSNTREAFGGRILLGYDLSIDRSIGPSLPLILFSAKKSHPNTGQTVIVYGADKCPVFMCEHHRL